MVANTAPPEPHDKAVTIEALPVNPFPLQGAFRAPWLVFS